MVAPSDAVKSFGTIETIRPAPPPPRPPQPKAPEEGQEEKKLDSVDNENPHPVTGEVGGPKGAYTGAEPTRYGDWELRGRCSDF